MFAFQCCENLPLISIESFVSTLNQDDDAEDLSQVNGLAVSPSISNLQSLF